MSKKVDCVCLEDSVFPTNQSQCALGDKCVDDCGNCTIGWVSKTECEFCRGTGKMKVLAGKTALSRSGRLVRVVCHKCGNVQRCSMGSDCQLASACSKHLELRV